ncbi:MAG: Fic family protein [Anaerolineae bacterium]|nr:Fic family protein [Anaerolineae bacterium]
MRIPTIPPKVDAWLQKTVTQKNSDKVFDILTRVEPTDNKDRYLHWDEFRYKAHSNDFTVEEHWVGTKFARSKLLKGLPLYDKFGNPFYFGMPDCVLRMLHEIDQNASGRIRMAEPIMNVNTRDAYLINSLIEEAISSSQLEGAATTRKVAKEMIRQNRPPRDRSEQMILNNFHAMQFVQENRDERLTPPMIYELHRIVTEKTLDNPEGAGRLRTSNDIQVVDTEGNILHDPPKSVELPERLKRICDFVNNNKTTAFVHPVIKAILLHFMLAYDHPFDDGNGRTARALFYWYMAKEKYWLVEFISISQTIKKAPVRYARAFLYTETDDNDTTYFIDHQLKVILKAIEQLNSYLARKMQDLKSVAQLLERTKLAGVLNHRQLALLENALKNPNSIYHIKGHQHVHGVTYQTARTDLLELSDELNLLHKMKDGKTFLFLSPADLRQRLEVAKLRG